jgi:hypothetical protein
MPDMTFIGDLERAFATALYPNRVAIALGLVIVLIVLAVVARRRGWLSAARRHPWRSALLAVALLAVGGPTGWYLGSPLFIRTELTEAAPTPVPSQARASPPAASVHESVSPASPGAALAATRTGMFEGADEFHFGQGKASLIEVRPGSWTLRFDDFSVRNGPDLYVYLSPDPTGYADGAIELGTLKATDGAFNTDIPAGTDVSTVRSVVIWCKQFSVEFAVAPLD